MSSKKEPLPLEFLTQFVSRGWEEVGNLKAEIDSINREFTGTSRVEGVLQGLLDSYLIAIGQMELYLDKKDYLNLPDDEELEPLKEDLGAENEQPQKPILGNAPKQPQENPILGNAKKQSQSKPQGAQAQKSTTTQNNDDDKPIPMEQPTSDKPAPTGQPQPQPVRESFDEGQDEGGKASITDFFVDFDDPEPDAEADASIKAWLSK